MRSVFANLRAIRAFRKRNLAFLETMVDYDVVLEIGYHQEAGVPLTINRLHALGVCSVPTLQRCLRRLRNASAIRQTKTAKDARVVELTLSPRLLRIYRRYGDLVASVFSRGRRRAKRSRRS
jgi:hypothetical protein